MIFRAAIGCALAMGIASAALTQQIDTTRSASQSFQVDLNAPRKSPFVIRLRIPDTPEAIKHAEIYDARGRELEFRVLLAGDSAPWILGTHLPGVSLEIIHRAGDNEFVLQARDADGNLITIARDDLHLTDRKYGDYCFDFAAMRSADLPIYIKAAIDISGSMDTFIPDVRKSFKEFLAQVPERSLCQVTLFDSETHYLDPEKQDWQTKRQPLRACNAFKSDKVLARIKSRGLSTNIVEALRPLYDANGITKASQINVVLSDGAGDAKRGSRAFRDLIAAREEAVTVTGVYTLVNWLGFYKTDFPLADLADQSVFGTMNATAGQAAFDATALVLDAQHHLTITDCP